ncbi:ComF family protein [Vibrio sinus]
MAHCGTCLSNPPLWHQLYCLSEYRPPLSVYLHKLKHGKQFWHASSLAQLLATRIDHRPDTITYVPLHWRRQLVRGFNQSELLARQLSSLLDVPLERKLFTRVKPTSKQQRLSKTQRKRNVQQAFRLNHPPKGKHIAIVDDVVTTGETVNQLVKLLIKQNVRQVDVYCICRTSDQTD